MRVTRLEMKIDGKPLKVRWWWFLIPGKLDREVDKFLTRAYTGKPHE